jgi:hypothetical protein
MTRPMTASAEVLRMELRPRRWSLERRVRAVDGALVLTGVMLGLHVHPLFHLLPALVGLATFWSGVTDGCGLGLLLAHSDTEQATE